VSSVAFAEPARALIWGGGASADDAAAAMKTFDASDAKAMLAFAPGFPRIVQSKDVKGLKAGFHIVLLGICGMKDDTWLPLSVAKSIEAKVYVRGVEHDGATACPTLKEPWKVESFVNNDRMHIGVIRNARTLRMFALLSDEKWEAADFVTDDADCTTACQGVDAKSNQVVWTDISAGCTTPDEQDMSWDVSLKKKRFSAKMVSGARRKGQCD
jgi:hypothetical protein